LLLKILVNLFDDICKGGEIVSYLGKEADPDITEVSSFTEDARKRLAGLKSQ